MRISDWSSDVCSSDLKIKAEMDAQRERFVTGCAANDIAAPKANELFDLIDKFAGYGFNKSHAAAYALVARSEERRVGKEWVSKCRSRWSPYHEKKKNHTTRRRIKKRMGSNRTS